MGMPIPEVQELEQERVECQDRWMRDQQRMDSGSNDDPKPPCMERLQHSCSTYDVVWA